MDKIKGRNDGVKLSAIRTMNRAFYNPETGQCEPGQLQCVGPDCRKCNVPLMLREELRALGAENQKKLEEIQKAKEKAAAGSNDVTAEINAELAKHGIKIEGEPDIQIIETSKPE